MIFTILIVFRTFFILLICGFNLSAQRTIDINRLDEILEEKYRTGEFSGISLISINKKVKYDKAFGYADFNDEELLFTDSEFNLGRASDIAKILSISWLLEKDKISLEDSVYHYLPGFKMYPEITIKHLLTHTSGLKDIKTDKEIIKYSDNLSLVEEILEKQSNVDPGNYLYSDVNSILTGAIIEKITGLKFDDFFYKTVSHVIGLPRTEFSTLKQATGYSKADSRYALGYIKNSSEEIITLDSENDMNLYPEGNLWTGGNDLLKMFEFLFHSKYISDNTLNKVLGSGNAPILFNKIGTKDNPGYGFYSETNGYNSLLYYFPRSKTQIIILSNYGFSSIFSDPYQILKEINLI